jgi:hypothetical protein
VNVVEIPESAAHDALCKRGVGYRRGNLVQHEAPVVALVFVPRLPRQVLKLPGEGRHGRALQREDRAVRRGEGQEHARLTDSPTQREDGVDDGRGFVDGGDLAERIPFRLAVPHGQHRTEPLEHG